ncbi:MAG: EndoU domain-containing protein, partial [Clostridium sp.]|nr:EndoU domain-containing protein [Clostridium sp.]MCM1172347.1 EndoU domain-containing protein [Clostridium sp.]
QAEIMGVYKADAQTALNARSQYAVAGKGIETSYGKTSLNLLKNTENFMDSAIEHIFEGQINARGKAVGYHYEGIKGTSGKIIPGTESSVNNLGVYKAQVEVRWYIQDSQ